MLNFLNIRGVKFTEHMIPRELTRYLHLWMYLLTVHSGMSRRSIQNIVWISKSYPIRFDQLDCRSFA